MKFKDVLSILKPYRSKMALIMLFAVVISAIAAVTPFVSQNMIDNGLLKNNIKAVVIFVVLIIILQTGSQLIEYLQKKQEITITNALGKKMKIEALDHGLKLKPHYFKEQGFYKTIGDALYDISSIMSITDNGFLTIFVIICKCIGAAVGLVLLDWRLALFVAGIMPVKLLLNIIMRKRAEKFGEQLMVVNKNYNAWFSNIIHGIIDIKLWNLNKKTLDEYTEHIQTINESSRNLSLMRAKNNLLTQSTEFIMMNSLYILGAFLIAGNQLTMGGLVAFISFTSYVLMPVNIIMNLRIILKQIKPSLAGIKRFNDLEEENYAASSPLTGKISTIEFRNVSVSLDGRDILKNINLKIHRGEKVAIVGDNGSGKTTIINLLLRFCEPTKGEILVDDVPISEYNVEDYRQKFSVVTQDIHLFKGTVKDNITFDKEAQLSINKDSRLKFCTETIESWDHNYETEVGSEGTKLSGGERQKIALLRALNRKSEILVLDEPTSNYDKASDNEFNDFIKKNKDFDFYFIVTHRNGILSHVDKMLSLENGNLNENVS